VFTVRLPSAASDDRLNPQSLAASHLGHLSTQSRPSLLAYHSQSRSLPNQIRANRYQANETLSLSTRRDLLAFYQGTTEKRIVNS
jgi:hypothetical protein